ncbi:MAG: hypothetical protein WKF30_06310 [Pyrinomonadaceae bacterium]
MSERAENISEKQASESVRILLSSLIDYAGLFPPAGLDMESAVRRYGAHLSGPDKWILGRFIVSASRLEEFEQTAASLLPRKASETVWRLSALVGPDLNTDVGQVLAFNKRHNKTGEPGAAVIDSLECKTTGAEEIRFIRDSLPASCAVYCEIPIDSDPGELVRAVAEAKIRAKVRTGGTSAESFPSTFELARFIKACADWEVPFKATAGLHHPIRATHALTDEQTSASAVMHGFLNVFLAAAFARSGRQIDEVVEMLEEKRIEEIYLTGDGVKWRKHKLDNGQLRDARERFALSFGSCSFDEPMADLHALGLL